MGGGRRSHRIKEEKYLPMTQEELTGMALKNKIPFDIIQKCHEMIPNPLILFQICRLHSYGKVEVDILPFIAELIRGEQNARRIQQELKKKVGGRIMENFHKERTRNVDKEQLELEMAMLKDKIEERLESSLKWETSTEGLPHETATTIFGVYRAYPEGMWKFEGFNPKNNVIEDCSSMQRGKVLCQKHHQKLEREGI